MLIKKTCTFVNILAFAKVEIKNTYHDSWWGGEILENPHPPTKGQCLPPPSEGQENNRKTIAIVL